MSDWIEWSGGPCPVEGGVRVSIRLRCGGLAVDGDAGIFNWRHGGGAFAYENDDDIIAYRIARKESHATTTID